MSDDRMRFQHRMSDSDALMWTIEKDPSLRSTITAVLLLDRAPERNHLHDLLERGTRLVPRMRQRVRGNPLSVAPPRWEVDPNFDLSFHLRWVRAGGDRTLRSVLDLAGPIAMQGFDRARPLWEMTVVEDMVDGRAAVIMKIHHAITDGVGAVKIALVLFELERNLVEVVMPESPEVHVMSQTERFLDALDHERRRTFGIASRSVGNVGGAVGTVLSNPAAVARGAADLAGSAARMLAPQTSPLSPVMTQRSLSVHFNTISVSMADAKAAARAAGCKLNDAFVAATCEAMRRYHEALDAPVTHLRMSMPINIRNDETEDLAGNQFAPARFAVPVAIDDPIERMRVIRDLVAEQRHEPALALVDPMARLLNQLPTSVSTGLFGAMLKGIDMVTSNVPGAPFPIYTAGARIEAMFAFGPMAGAAVNITLLSYLEDLLIGVNVDPAAVADPDLLMACYAEGWDDVLKAAS